MVCLTMLRVLLILLVTSVVYGQLECPNFSTYKNIDGLKEDLNGTFFVLSTSGDVAKCERSKYTIDAKNVTTGYIESFDCCLKQDNFNFSSTELSYNIGPAPGYNTTGCPIPLNETLNAEMKLLATIGTGRSLCLITAVCQSGGYSAFYVMCRQQTLPLSLNLYLLVSNVLGILGLSIVNGLKTVDQTNCAFATNNCAF